MASPDDAEPTSEPTSEPTAEPTSEPASELGPVAATSAPDLAPASGSSEPDPAPAPDPAPVPSAPGPELGHSMVEGEFLDLLKDAKTGKQKHFHAAQRKQSWHSRFGISALVLTSAASVAAAVRDFLPDSLVVLAGMALPACAAVLVGLQTFLRLEKMVEGHRTIANGYLRLHRDGKAVFARRLDGRMPIEELDKLFAEYRTAYDKLNTDSEAFTTSREDLPPRKTGGGPN